MRQAKLGDSISSGGLGELKRRLLFLLLAILVFRFASYIPIPGIDPILLAQKFSPDSSEKQNFLSMFNMFSGGAFRRMTIMALSIMPYISSSIIVQMYSSISPKLIQLKKEGQSGRQKINTYTRIGTLLLAIIQSYFISIYIGHQTLIDKQITVTLFTLLCVTSLVTGTMFLLWLGEQVTEKGIGNGISFIIFAGIVSRFPHAIGQLSSKHFNVIKLMMILLVILFVTLVVVTFERAQRRILIKYAKRQVGNKIYGGQSQHMPLKINMAGVIPPIFAQSILMFFGLMPTFLGAMSKPGIVQSIFNHLQFGQPVWMIVFAILVIFFGFFYTSIMFNPKEMSDNLRNQGGYIEGIRPGAKTADYLDKVVSHLTCYGTIYLAAVSLLPAFLRDWFDVPFYFGGTSLLIVVVVLIDFLSQVQSHIFSAQYQSLMKKTKDSGKGFVRR